MEQEDIKKHLGSLAKTCHICEVPLEELEKAFSQEKLGDIFHFCSQECYDTFLKKEEETEEPEEELTEQDMEPEIDYELDEEDTDG